MILFFQILYGSKLYDDSIWDLVDGYFRSKILTWNFKVVCLDVDAVLNLLYLRFSNKLETLLLSWLKLYCDFIYERLKNAK